MALLLLLKLLEPNTSKRYTADKVLKHPWITRNPIDDIPKTYLETMRIRTLKNKLINVKKNNLFKNLLKFRFLGVFYSSHNIKKEILISLNFKILIKIIIISQISGN